MSEEYRVNLDIYNGPLDLLLYLIRRDELDIYDIPISHIADQYMQYVDVIRTLDPNLAGEFLVMAATLMEIKTRMLLPTPPPEADSEETDAFDPRGDLVRQLLEYKAFKDAAGDLRTSADEQAMSYPRRPAKPDHTDTDIDIDSVQVWDLMAAFSRVLAEIGQAGRIHEVIYDDTPIELHEEDILDLLNRHCRVTFSDIFRGRKSRGELVGLFLAVLQLVAQREVLVSQDIIFGEIVLELNPDPPELPLAADPTGRSQEATPGNTRPAAAGPGGFGRGQDSSWYESDPARAPEEDEDLDEFDDDDDDLDPPDDGRLVPRGGK